MNVKESEGLVDFKIKCKQYILNNVLLYGVNN